MFKAKKKTGTTIGTASRIEGSLFSKEDMVIDGMVIGKVSTTGNLEIKKTAQIKGDLIAGNIIVAGIVEGEIKAKKNLEITGTSQVYGNIDSRIFSIATGAVFIGKCKGGEEKKAETKEVIKAEEDLKSSISNEVKEISISKKSIDK